MAAIRGSVQAPTNAAGASQAQNWLTHSTSKTSERVWREAGTIFRTRISADGWASVIIPVRKPLGPVLSRSLAKVMKVTSLPGAPAGEYEILEFQTDFAAKRGAIAAALQKPRPSAG